MDHRAKRVAIVGAGTSGLAACKHLLARGFRPVVFEAGESVGGLWTRTLASTRLQSPAAVYRYSDFPWPDSAGAFPLHDQVVDYLASYARRFGVDGCVRFRRRVVAAEYVGAEPEGAADGWARWNGNGEAFGDGSGAWHLTVGHRGESEQEPETQEVHEFDFLILCIGSFKGGHGPGPDRAAVWTGRRRTGPDRTEQCRGPLFRDRTDDGKARAGPRGPPMASYGDGERRRMATAGDYGAQEAEEGEGKQPRARHEHV